MTRCSAALRVAALAMAVSMAVACGGSDADPVPFVDVTSEVFGSYPLGNYSFRSQEELTAVWGPFTQSGAGATELPIFDFGSNMVVGVSLGVGIRCYIPTITGVTRSGSTLTVSWQSTWPDGFTTQACRHAWPLSHFVAVPQHQGRVVFVRVPA
ncbi:MAG: hypothetical protein MUF55_11655 [Hydrogenophaga sp.]|nr:hypothetical protein [Hydrogenophaga sp.]